MKILNLIEQRIESFGAEKIFIALFLFFGLMICLMRPPYRLMDEPVHFARAWQISEGIFISPLAAQDEVLKTLTGNNQKSFGWKNLSSAASTEKMYTASLPVSLVPDKFIFDVMDDSCAVKFSFDELKKFLTMPLNVDERELGLIPNTGVYSPLAYFPQAVAALIGRNLNLGAGMIYYLMNFSGLIFVAMCVFLSMKLLPEMKTLIFLLAMLPMFLIEAASTSIDALTYGVCFLATAWLLSLRNSIEKFSRAEIFGLIILSIMLACSKSVYGTILLLYFLIPRERCKKFWLFGAAILLLNLLTSLIWLELSVGMTGAELPTSRHYLGVENVDANAQKNFVLEHPQEFLRTLFNSLFVVRFYYWFGFFGLWGANGELYLPVEFYLFYGVALIIFALKSDLKLKFGERFVMVFAATISVLAFFLVSYFQWTTVGAKIIRGVQGRYFIPIAPLIFGALSMLPPLKNKNSIALMIGISSGVVTLATNFFAFY